MIMYHDEVLDKDVEIRYTYVLRRYEADCRTFNLSIHVVPSVLLTPNVTASRYTGLSEVLFEFTQNFKFADLEGDTGVISFSFNKNTTDEIFEETIKNMNSFFESKGITPAGTLGLVCGAPSIEYGQAYLEYTTSLSNRTMMNLFDGLVSPEAFQMAIADVPVTSEQKFDPEKDTNDNYMKGVIRKLYMKTLKNMSEKLPEGEKPEVKAKLEKLLKATETLTKIDSLMEDLVGLEEGLAADLDNVEVLKDEFDIPKETYSSEDSKEYDNFQSAWI